MANQVISLHLTNSWKLVGGSLVEFLKDPSVQGTYLQKYMRYGYGSAADQAIASMRACEFELELARSVARSGLTNA